MVREAVLLNGIEELAMMKLDVLDGLKSVKLCTAYKYKGKLFKEFPHDLEVLNRARPVYLEMPGWERPKRKPRQYKDLPLNCRNYIAKLSDILKTRIAIVSVGSGREDTIFV